MKLAPVRLTWNNRNRDWKKANPFFKRRFRRGRLCGILKSPVGSGSWRLTTVKLEKFVNSRNAFCFGLTLQLTSLTDSSTAR